MTNKGFLNTAFEFAADGGQKRQAENVKHQETANICRAVEYVGILTIENMSVRS